MICPHCESPLEIYTVPLDQERVSVSITWEGAFIEARTVAGVIENTRNLLAASAKESTGIAYNVVMHGIDWGEHEASFHFVLLSPVSPERKP